MYVCNTDTINVRVIHSNTSFYYC